MSESTRQLRQELRELHGKRRTLLRSLTSHHELAQGSVSVVRRKCGKSNCHCAEGVGHPQTLFLFQGPDGRRHCQLIRKADADRWLRAGECYRTFRQDLRQLRALNRREERILVALMERRALEYS